MFNNRTACPKILADGDDRRITEVGPFRLPPACIYVFPATIPSVRNNANPKAQSLLQVEILQAFHTCFQGRDEEVNYIDFEVAHRGTDVVRKTTVTRNGTLQRQSELTAIRRA